MLAEATHLETVMTECPGYLGYCMLATAEMKLTLNRFAASAVLRHVLAAENSSTPAKPRKIEGGNGVTLPPPPPTEVTPVTETIHGVTITDPYRWLEDGQSPATRK
jgi:hypothetical protein